MEFWGEPAPSNHGKEMAMLQELTVEEMDQVSGGVTAGEVVAGAAIVAGAIGIAVFTPELVAAWAVGDAAGIGFYGSGVGMSALDAAMGSIVLVRPT